MPDESGAVTRSQTKNMENKTEEINGNGQSGKEDEQHEGANGGEDLDETVKENNKSTSPLSPQPALPPQPVASEEFFKSLMSSVVDLQAAVADIRAEMKEGKQANTPMPPLSITHGIVPPQNMPKSSMQQSAFANMPPSIFQENQVPIGTQQTNLIGNSQHQSFESANSAVGLSKPPSFHSHAIPIRYSQRSANLSVPPYAKPPALNSSPFRNTYLQQPASNYPLSSDTSFSRQPVFNSPHLNNMFVNSDTNMQTERYNEMSTKLYNLPNFDGKPEDWPLFFATYSDTTAEYRYSNRQNLMRLQKALHGRAKDSVVSMLIHPENVPQIIEELAFHFGRPELLIKSQLEKIKIYPTVHEGRVDGIMGLATCARNMVAFFKSAKCENHLMNPMLLEQFILKLPLSKQYEWAKFSTSITSCPTVEHFAKWVGDLARVYSLIPQRQPVATNDRQQHSSSIPRRVLHSSEHQAVQEKRSECQQCKGSHELTECQAFSQSSTHAKWEQVKKFRVCFGCLRKGHNLTQCRQKKACSINGCTRFHHPSLHQDISPPHVEQPNRVLQCHQNETTRQLFKVLPVTIHGPNGSSIVYALLDEGSSVSLLEDNVAKSLGLKGQRSTITLQWYDNIQKTENSMKVNLEISANNVKAQKYALKNIRTVTKLSLPFQSFDKNKFDYLKHLPIQNYFDKKPSILIGLDNCHLGLAKQVVEANSHLPVASETKLGWVAYGPTTENNVNNIARICHISESNTLQDINKLVNDYFSVENFGVKSTNLVLESDANKRARTILENTTRKIESHYETGLLWKKDGTVMPDSFEMAKQRLFKVENKMQRDPVYAASYKREMGNYIRKGYAIQMTSQELENHNCNTIWYLPHFGVTSPHKPDKLRIVFDAAAVSSNVSLNSVLLKGPEHAKSLQTILYQFRQGKIAVAGDIQEMFSQVSIVKTDQNSQRFLWRDGDKDCQIKIFVMQSMIFGAISSPCCAEYIKNINANKFMSTMPGGADVIINKTYVDDLVASFNSQKEAMQVTSEAITINAAAGFNLRNFSSNCLPLEAALNNGNVGKSNPMNMEKQSQIDKILGLYWNKSTDRFEFHVKFYKISPDVLNGTRPPTKREVLGIMMAIFDPFGFLSNFTIYSKLLLQKIWKLGVQWDEKLPHDIVSQWNLWWKEFHKLKQFSIPRCYSTFLNQADEIQLHIFVDASSQAYAAVAYLRVSYGNEVDTSLISAKSRCAPPKGMTIPRLELQAAVLGSRLKTSIEESHEFKISRIIFWCDSKTVVLWIRSTVREYKQFVACRIAEILSTTSPDQWRWLPTQLNIADEATRAKLPVDFGNESRWIIGPKFLKLEEGFWPKEPSITEADQDHDEEKTNTLLLVRPVEQPLINFQKFSSYLKLKRMVAWLLRFINHAKKSTTLSAKSKELTVSEISSAEKLICRLVQMEAYPNEISLLTDAKKILKSSHIHQLSPYLDEDTLLRVNGRIDNALYLPESARRPIIMPTNHHVTKLIVLYHHQIRRHQNDNLIINEVRQTFWIPNIRSVLKSVKKGCPICIRNSVQPISPMMGQLPNDRLEPFVRPFSYVGVDYCGPFYITIGRRNEKRWIALFTCMSTRAIHLEISDDLSTDAFLICFRNFVNRRGVPVRVRSDNGTNFVGAQKEMTPENRYLDFTKIQHNLCKDKIEWVFNCPANPHAGGIWERLVRCVKNLLHMVFKEEAPRLSTFRSAVIEAENIINNRPLTQLPVDPTTEEPLTPNHFLLGGLSSTQTPGPEDEKVCLRKQWRIAQNLKDRLWKKWVVEYLPQLICRPKWRDKVRPLQVGDLVIVLDPNQPRSQWKMGKILQVFPGKDGQVRSAEVQTSNGAVRRPAVKLALMNFNESSQI